MEQIPPQPSGSNITTPISAARKSGLVTKILGVIVVLGVVGSGALLATRIWDPVWNPFRPSPEKVMALMSEKMQAVKSSHSEIKLDIDMKGGTTPGKLSIVFSGDGDVTNPQNLKTEGELRVSFIGEVAGAGEQLISGKIKTKIIGQEGYFTITELNAPSLVFLFTMMGIDLNTATGTWIRFPIENKLGEGAETQTAALTEKMRKIISDSKVYVVKKQLPDQAIEGQKMYHYLVALDKEKTTKLFSELIMAAQESGESIFFIGMVEGMIRSLFDAVGEISAELLIGKNDYFLYGLKSEKTIDLNKLDNKMQGLVDISFETNNSKFNQPVRIEAPLEYKNFEEVFPPLENISPFPVFDEGVTREGLLK